MARVLVSGRVALAVGMLIGVQGGCWFGRTVAADGVGCLVDDLGWAFDGEAGPFFHG